MKDKTSIFKHSGAGTRFYRGVGAVSAEGILTVGDPGVHDHQGAAHVDGLSVAAEDVALGDAQEAGLAVHRKAAAAPGAGGGAGHLVQQGAVHAAVDDAQGVQVAGGQADLALGTAVGQGCQADAVFHIEAAGEVGPAEDGVKKGLLFFVGHAAASVAVSAGVSSSLTSSPRTT